jgi:hypothetical protein
MQFSLLHALLTSSGQTCQHNSQQFHVLHSIMRAHSIVASTKEINQVVYCTLCLETLTRCSLAKAAVPGCDQTLAKRLLDIARSTMPSAFCISQAILYRRKTALYDFASVPLALVNVRTTKMTEKLLM